MTFGGKISNDGKHGPKFEDNPTHICCTKHDEMYFKNYQKKKKKIWKKQIYTPNKAGVLWKNLD